MVINFVEEVSRKITDNGVAVEKIYLYLTIYLLLVNHIMNRRIFFVPKCNFKFISNMQFAQRNKLCGTISNHTHMSGTSFPKKNNLSVTLNAITTGNFEYNYGQLSNKKCGLTTLVYMQSVRINSPPKIVYLSSGLEACPFLIIS